MLRVMILAKAAEQLGLFGAPAPVHVKAHVRRTKTGAVAHVRQHQRIALIACSKIKHPAGKDGPIPARQLYSPSTLFSSAVRHVETSDPHGGGWYVLSARHGVLAPDDKITHYDEAMTDLPAPHRRAWARRVVDQLRERGLLGHGHTWEIHAGKAYSTDLTEALTGLGERWVDPLAGKMIGQRKGFYRAATEDPQAAAPAAATPAPPTTLPDRLASTEAQLAEVQSWLDKPRADTEDWAELRAIKQKRLDGLQAQHAALTALARSHTEREQARTEGAARAQAGAARMAELIEQHGGPKRLRVWHKEGAGTRLYFPGQAGFLAFTWDGGVSSMERGRQTLTESALYPAWAKALRTATTAYRAEESAKVATEPVVSSGTLDNDAWSHLRQRAEADTTAPSSIGEFTVRVSAADRIEVKHGNHVKDAAPDAPMRDRSKEPGSFDKVGAWFTTSPSMYGPVQASFHVPPGDYAVFGSAAEDFTHATQVRSLLSRADNRKITDLKRDGWDTASAVNKLTYLDPTYRAKLRDWYTARGYSGLVLRSSELDRGMGDGQLAGEPHDVWLVFNDQPITPSTPWTDTRPLRKAVTQVKAHQSRSATGAVENVKAHQRATQEAKIHAAARAVPNDQDAMLKVWSRYWKHDPHHAAGALAHTLHALHPGEVDAPDPTSPTAMFRSPHHVKGAMRRAPGAWHEAIKALPDHWDKGTQWKAKRQKHEAKGAAEEEYERLGVDADHGPDPSSLRGRKVWLYHGTTDKFTDTIKRDGLRPGREVGTRSNVGSKGNLNKWQDHVLLTGDPGHQPGGAAAYARLAAQRHGGNPVVFRTLVDGDRLSRDRDDSDLTSGRHQYRVDQVHPHEIAEVDGEKHPAFRRPLRKAACPKCAKAPCACKAKPGDGPKKASGAKPAGHWCACTCKTGCKEHAHWKVRCGESGEEYTLRVPHGHRYDPHGWPADGRKASWKGEAGHKVGLVVAEGPAGITAHDGQAYHRVRHGQWKPHAAAAGHQPLRKAAADLQGKVGAKPKHPPLGAGERWITVHPNGKDEKGVPVKISENKDGTHSIVGGAGGKLNHLRLTDVKDPGSDEAKAQEKESKERRKAKEQGKKAKAAEVEAGRDEEQKEEAKVSKSDLETAKLVAERRRIEAVRSALGGVSVDREDEFKTVEAAKGKGVANRLRTALHKQQLREADARLKDAKNALVDHTIAEAESRRIIEQAIEEKPEIAATARKMAEEALAEEAQDDKERKAARVMARQRATSGKTKVGEKAAAIVEEKLGAINEDKLHAKLAAAGGRDDAEAFGRTGSAVEEIDRRALQATDDGIQLAKFAQGTLPLEEMAPGARKALEKAAGKKDLDDPDVAKAVATAEAAIKFRRAERERARAAHYNTLENPDQALAYIDALVNDQKGYSEAAKKLGLRETEKTPLQTAEVEELIDLLKNDVSAKAAIKAFKAAEDAIEAGDYTKARDALTITTGEVDDAAVLASVGDEVRTRLAKRIRSLGDQRDPHYVTAHAAGQYDALADTALGIAKQRYIDRSTVDAVGARNATILLRHALESDGHDPKAVMAAVESHHVATQEKLTQDALDRAEKIVPGLEHKVGEVGSIEHALNDLDAHHLDVQDAQRAVGTALGRMEGLASVAWAMKQKAPESIELGDKDTDLDGTLAWLHASGLREGDYSVDYKSKVASIPKASFDKLIKRESPETVQQRTEALAIKRGEKDEKGWLAPGIVSRTASSFTDPLPSRTLFREPADFAGLDDKAMERDSLRYEHGGNERAVSKHERAIKAEASIPKMQREAEAYNKAGQSDEAQTVLRRVEGITQAAANSKGAIGRAKELHEGSRDALARHQSQHGDLEGRTVESALREHVASRLADGEPAAEVASDLVTPAAMAGIHPDHREHYHEAIRSIFPLTDSSGRSQRVEASADQHRAMVSDWAAKKYGEGTATFHAQDLRTDDPKTHEAVFRALAEHPAAGAAFKAPGDLTPQDRAAIRAHMEKKLAKAEVTTAGASKLQKKIDALGPEPEKQDTKTITMFGGPAPINAAWTAWNKQRAALTEDHGEEAGTKSAWANYVQTHGDRDAALAAARDDLRGDYMRSLHGHWSRLHGEPLIAGSALVSGAEKHALALGDPERAKQARARMQKLQAALADKNRQTSGKYGSGSYKEELSRQLVAEKAQEQAQAGMFGATPAPAAPAPAPAPVAAQADTPRSKALAELGDEPEKHDPNQSSLFGAPAPTQEWSEWNAKRKAIDAEHGPEPEAKAAPAAAPEAAAQTTTATAAPKAPKAPEVVQATTPETSPGERVSLGHMAEAQLDSIVPHMARNFDPKADPINLAKITGLRQDGEFIHHQRVVKQLLATGRQAAYLQTGSGKTLVSLSGFTALHDAGKATHGLFLTPAKVRDQFGAEVARFTKPGAYGHQSDRGKDHGERVAMLADHDTHIRTMTHEGFRDTALKMMADHHHGGDVEATVEEFRGLNQHERADKLREALDAHGVPRSYTYVDEVQNATTRSDTNQSLMHMVLMAAAHPTNATGLLVGTATPHKNDEREAASLFAMLDPHGHGDAHEVMQQMGGHLPSSMASMRAEMGHLTYMAGTKPDVERTDTNNPKIDPKSGEKYGGAPLQLEGKHAEHVHSVAEAYDRIRKGNGTTADAKVLSPGRFADAPESEHDGIAQTMMASSAIHFNRDHAFRRAINRGGPAASNVKVKAVTDVLKHDKGKGKRSIVFSDSVKELHYLREHLESQGLKVGVLTGSEDAADFMRRAAPERGEPEFDTVLMSKAGSAGLNLQPYSVQHNYDTPSTHASHDQRAGRIFRSGQSNDVEIHNWHTDHPFEQAALRRLRRKESLSEAFQSSTPLLDDEHGVASSYERALADKHKASGAMDDTTPARSA